MTSVGGWVARWGSLWSAVYCFSLLVCVRDFLPSFLFFAWVRSVLSVGGRRSLPLFCVFLVVRPSCIVWGFLPLLSFAVLPFSSMQYFIISFLGLEFLPFGCLFHSPLFLPAWSLWVSYFFFISGLFLWSLLWLSCVSSRLACFAIGLFLCLLVPRSSAYRFLYAWYSWCLRTRPYPGGPSSGVSPLPIWSVSFGRCPVLFLSLVLLSPFPLFRVFVRPLRPLSLCFLALVASAP